MEKEQKVIKILKISDLKGQYFCPDKSEYKPINLITKDDLIKMITFIIKASNEQCVFDESTDENLPNKTQKIIYDAIREKLVSLNESKDEIINNVNKEFEEARKKYIDNKIK